MHKFFVPSNSEKSKWKNAKILLKFFILKTTQIYLQSNYNETEDDSYMGDAAIDVDVEPQSPPW